MRKYTRRNKRSGSWRLATLILVAVGGARLIRRAIHTPLAARLFTSATEAADRSVRWHRMPTPLGLLTLVGIRMRLRQSNLHDTSGAPSVEQPVAAPEGDRHLTARTADGTYNDLGSPMMGSAGMRFGRNVPVDGTYPDNDWALLRPSPRTVSRELLTRHTFQPATTLNVLAAAWLQFMIRDWFSHGKSETENPWKVDLEAGDPWHENPMTVLRTRRDPTRPEGADGLPPTYANTESHWWDASQIYGSNKEFQSKVRSGQDGKLTIGADGLIPIDFGSLSGLTDVTGWWLGLSLMHTVFILEHNAICDRLREEYPSWSDDELFDRARLINAALLAKIHTVEWTTAILGHPTMQIGMRANWWGLAGERLYRLLGRISSSEVISGIAGSPTNHFNVPYALTEEFVAVYRMHPLVPDEYDIRSVEGDRPLRQLTFREIAGRHAEEVTQQVPMTDLLYSFGTEHPGAVQLHNFPRFLQEFERPDGRIMDLAATDILRTRELGVPRYNEFRELMHLPPAKTFEELTDNAEWVEELRRVYEGDIDSVDLMIGMYAEAPPDGRGFSDTAFRIFVLMASRRLNSDRFFTTDYTPEVYTQVGMDWIDDNDMSSVLLRHYPGLEPALRGIKNAFAPWTRVTA